MKNKLDGQSFFTSDIAILICYAGALIALCTGVLGLATLVAVVIVGMMAKKEGAVIVAKHCSWIANTIWVAIISVMLVTIGAIVGFSTIDPEAFDNAQFDSYEQLINNPGMQDFMIVLWVALAVLAPVFIWYVYRVIRGAIGVFKGRTPK